MPKEIAAIIKEAWRILTNSLACTGYRPAAKARMARRPGTESARENQKRPSTRGKIGQPNCPDILLDNKIGRSGLIAKEIMTPTYPTPRHPNSRLVRRSLPVISDALSTRNQTAFHTIIPFRFYITRLVVDLNIRKFCNTSKISTK